MRLLSFKRRKHSQTNTIQCFPRCKRHGGIKKGNINIVVSVDAGTKETFKKVKRLDFYDKVWENIAKYAAVQNAPNLVKTKFILIPEINDTKEEIESWIKKSIESGLKHLSFYI